MRRARTPQQWTALRLLREHETPVTYELLAEAAGRELTGDDIRMALENGRQGISHAWLLNTQLAAMQQLLDGEPPTLNRVAAVADVDISTATNEGIRAGWKKPNIPHWRRRVRAELATDAGVEAAVKLASFAADPQVDEAFAPGPEMGRAARVSAMLVKHADALLSQMERQGGTLTKPQLDAMLAMVRLAEKFEPLAEKEAAEQQKKSDAEVAEIYDQIEQRILERATFFAHRMVAKGDVHAPVRDRARKLGARRKQQPAPGA